MASEREDRRNEDREIHRRRRSKNLALLAALVAFCVLVYLITIVRMG
ncbi:MAG: hypothetical protein R3316_00260 [Rhodovibrionaceae bacterium]|nr:hypothetical protein [Rhodovibrionaceae bacterium]